MHFLIQLLFTQPDLLAEHARAYVELVSSEIAEASAVPLFAALACFRTLRAKGNAPAFAKVKEQIQADTHMLREIRTP